MSTKRQKATLSSEITEASEISHSELWNQLGHAVTMAAKEDQIIWTIFGVFWAANAVLLAAFFTTGDLPEARIGIIVSATGAILSLVWIRIQRRAIRWLLFYEGIILQLEKKYLKVPPDISLSPDINKASFDKIVGPGRPSVRLLMIVSGVAAALIWTAVLLFFESK